MRKGFTLIELLVVVLIIGILAAIALPQYTKAVEKSRAAEAVLMVKTLKSASDVYFLANNEYPTKFDELHLGLPPSVKSCAASGVAAITDCVNLGTYQYELRNSTWLDINARKTDLSLVIQYNYKTEVFACVAKNEEAKRSCAVISGKSTPDSTDSNGYYYNFS
ncbi:prepilin-type N-terminal cleavage/methylation domain-containing protein [Elusimicrobium posterum]|uniref:type IV pilin protein n=1 Tax=Elusimicrobium posterum TaxID=3116653 RepID=UPI003C718DFF